MTVDGLISMLTEQYGVELSMLSSGVTILFSDFLDRKKMKVNTLTGDSLYMYCMYVLTMIIGCACIAQERRGMTIKTLVETVTKKVCSASSRCMYVCMYVRRTFLFFEQALPATQKYLILEIIVNDVDTAEEVEIPYLRFKLIQ